MKKYYIQAGLLAAAIIIAYLIIRRSKSGGGIEDITDDLPGSGYPRRSLDDIKFITLHHTAGPSSQTAEQINAYHRSNKGWPRIGYHFLIYPDGGVKQVNDLTTASYHNGVNNFESVGVSFVGDFSASSPTLSALRAARGVVAEIKRKTTAEAVNGHKDLKSTACPGGWDYKGFIRSTVLPFGVPARSASTKNFVNESESDN